MPTISNATTYIDQLKTAVITLDKTYNVCYLNSAAENFFHLSAKRAQQLSFKDFFTDAQDLFKIIERSIAKGDSYTKRRISITLHDLHQATVDFSVTPLDDSILLEINTLDRFLRISSEENTYNSQEATKLMVRGLAHEIKNPLAGIQGAAQLLSKAVPEKQIQEYTQIIISEIKRLVNLVDRLLIPNREMSYATVNIHEVAERVFQLLQAEISQKDSLAIHLHKDYDPSIPNLIADKSQLIQATLNIARNALEALSTQPQGNIYFKTRILRNFTMGGKSHKLVCELEIKDDGPGIPTQLRESLFMPMVTGRATGTGLGLSIAQSIINQHHGIISFESRPGETRFICHLPLFGQDETHR